MRARDCVRNLGGVSGAGLRPQARRRGGRAARAVRVEVDGRTRTRNLGGEAGAQARRRDGRVGARKLVGEARARAS